MTKDWDENRFNREAEIRPVLCLRCKKTANGRIVDPRELEGFPYCHECAAVLDVSLDTSGLQKFIKVELYENGKPNDQVEWVDDPEHPYNMEDVKCQK